jgi:DNA-binding transcriptional ArsR family regulator
VEIFPDIPGVASLLANAARARIAWALIDGSSRSAGHLASGAAISAQSASRHLALMLEGGLLEVESNGRARHYRIANSEVACMIESMASLAAELAGDRSPLHDLPRAQPVEFRQARTCYDHFAGRLGADLLRGILAAGWLESDKSEYRLTPTGEVGFTKLGIDIPLYQQQRRVFARPCADLSERESHLGGTLGTAVLDACISRGFVLRSRHSRVVTITPAGWLALRTLGLMPAA